MTVYIVKGLDGDQWVEKSRHSKKEDAERQQKIFANAGIDVANFKIVEETNG